MKIILIGILSCFTFFNVLGCSSGSSSDNPQPVITKIVIDTDGVKNNYFQSERLNLKNLKVVAVYSDNSSMPVTDYTTIPENNSSFDSAGEIDVLISYADFTKSFRINVEPISVTGISINSDNVKKNYVENISYSIANLFSCFAKPVFILIVFLMLLVFGILFTEIFVLHILSKFLYRLRFLHI